MSKHSYIIKPLNNCFQNLREETIIQLLTKHHELPPIKRNESTQKLISNQLIRKENTRGSNPYP